jgi:hypothetical protein
MNSFSKLLDFLAKIVIRIRIIDDIVIVHFGELINAILRRREILLYRLRVLAYDLSLVHLEH